MKKRENVNNILVFIIYVIIYIIPIYWLFFLDNSTNRSIIEGRKLIGFPSLSIQESKKVEKNINQTRTDEVRTNFFDDFKKTTFQTTIEQASSDQFPMRMNAIKLAKKSGKNINFYFI